jgi:hypothetical protein
MWVHPATMFTRAPNDSPQQPHVETEADLVANPLYQFPAVRLRSSFVSTLVLLGIVFGSFWLVRDLGRQVVAVAQ